MIDFGTSLEKHLKMSVIFLEHVLEENCLIVLVFHVYVVASKTKVHAYVVIAEFLSVEKRNSSVRSFCVHVFTVIDEFFNGPYLLNLYGDEKWWHILLFLTKHFCIVINQQLSQVLIIIDNTNEQRWVAYIRFNIYICSITNQFFCYFKCFRSVIVSYHQHSC